MATAVARRNSPRIGRTSSRAASPMDSKKTALKSGDNSRKNSPLQTKSSLPNQVTSQRIEDPKSAAKPTEPLAPPPRPAQTSNGNNLTATGANTDTKSNNNTITSKNNNNNGNGNGGTQNGNNGEVADYFSSVHNESSHFSSEPNPFEQSFAAPSQETPGKALLPSVAALTSPAIPGTSSTTGYNWGAHSLRSGPLSPDMLPGPAGSGNYFDSVGRGFPTPNESSLRTGLTPGGGGSMFPAPSPNSQALFQALQNGGSTPGTVDFHRTALNAAARNKNNQLGQPSNRQDENQPNTTMDKSQDQFASHDAEAANGLFMLAKGGQHGHPYPASNQRAQQQQPQPQPSAQKKPNAKQQDKHRRNTASMGSLSGPDMSGQQSDTHEEEMARANNRGGKRKKGAKAQMTAQGRRKADDNLPKPTNKRAKGNAGSTNLDPNLDQHDDDDDDDDDDDADSQDGEPTHDANGRKMTDEEKRKNFLERNRVAALKCRQRKKQWLANLQAKVELFSTENDALSGQVTQLREEIVNLKGLLLAHKDCPMGQAQGLSGMIMNGLGGDVSGGFANPHNNPYGMAMQNGGNMQATMQRS